MAEHLTELFQSYLTDFRGLVTRDPSPEIAATKAKELLTRLFDDYSRTVELGLLQRRIYPFVRDLSYAATAVLPALVFVPADVEPKTKSSRFGFFTFDEPVEMALELLSPIILILAFLFSGNLVVILIGVIWLLSVTIKRRKHGYGKHQPRFSEIKIDVNKMTDALRTIVSDADRLMREAGDLDEQKRTKKMGFWNDNPDILDLLHDLTEILETRDTEYAMKKLRVVPALLKSKGLRLAPYDGENKDWFDFFSSSDAAYSGSATIRPALLRNEELVRRGTVIQSTKH